MIPSSWESSSEDALKRPSARCGQARRNYQGKITETTPQTVAWALRLVSAAQGRMSPPPLISVIIPAYNAAGYLQRCLDSVLGQTLSDLEIIAVDDASSDGTGALLDRLAATDARLRVCHNPVNLGVHATRAAGVSSARGEYLGFVDSDDWIAADMYAQLLKAAQIDRADIVVCGAVCATGLDQLGEPKVRFTRREVVGSDIPGRFSRLEFGSGVLWNKLYRAEVIRPHALRPLERSVDAAEDYIVNFGAFADARRVVTLPESPYFYYLDPASATRRASLAESFCRTLRAYVVCLESQAGGGPGRRGEIDQLYVRQLRFSSYAVRSAEELMPWGDHLRESLRRLAQVHPAGIYALIHTFELPKPPAVVAVRPAARQLWSSWRTFARALQGRLRGRRATVRHRLPTA